MPAPKGYSATQIRLHWLVFLLIAFQLVFDENIGRAWRSVRRGEEVAFDAMVAAHVYAGIAVLALVVWRLAIRIRRGAPPPPEDESPALKLAARTTHVTLYALMLIVPLSGLVAWYGGVGTAGEVHEAMKPVLIILISLHVLAALYHQFVLKNGLLLRMRRPDA